MEIFDWSRESKDKWDAHAAFWSERSKDMWDSGSRKDIIPFFTKHLSSKSTVLDVGCGDAYGTYKLYQLGYRVIGADISSEMILKAKSRLPEVSFHEAAIEQLPLDSALLDGILCINVLEWVENPSLAIQELSRVLKPNGLLCAGILGPTAGPRQNSFRKVYGEKTICNNMMPWEFKQLVTDNKFEVIDEFGVYKKGVNEKHHKGLPIDLQQALTFMWIFMLRKEGE